MYMYLHVHVEAISHPFLLQVLVVAEQLLDGAAKRRQPIDVKHGRQRAVEQDRQKGHHCHHVRDVILSVGVHL